MTSKRKLKVGLLNVGSLGTRHDEFLVAMQRHDVDVMAINETWLRQGEEGRAPAVPGYRLRHVPRPAEVRARGGGVGFYIRRGVVTRVLPHPSTINVEQMWLQMSISGRKLIIGTAYRPPWLNVDIFVDGLASSIESFTWCDNIILLGDFNVNLLNSTDLNTKKIADFLQCYRITQRVTCPTHFTTHSETLIDVVCTDIKGTTVTVDYIKDLSSHAFILCQLNIPKFKPIPSKITRRSLKDIDVDEFQKDLVSMKWDYILSLKNVDEMVYFFNKFINYLFDIHAPLRVIYAKHEQYPWITYNIRQLMKRRDEAHSRARVSGQQVHMSFYKDLKYSVQEALVRERRAYFDHYVNHNKNNPKTMWKHIKKNVRLQNNPEIPSHILNDPDIINDHFMNVPGKVDVSISHLTFFEFQTKIPVEFQLKQVSENDILKIFRTLKSNAIGNDGISLDMIIYTLPNSLSAITAIVNKSIETNTFPTEWQNALIRPIPKISCPTTVKDLRPISILPCASKILEKVVANQLKNYMERNEILPHKQSGFRKFHSTTTAMLHVVDDILAAMDAGEGTLLVLLDFSRAFDCISVPLLLAKLHYYGFSASAIKWFDSYFKHRTQCVELSDEGGSTSKSQKKHIIRGVPQGSILGPLLFTLYSADVIDHIHYSNYHIYADDIQIYISSKPNDSQSAAVKLNEDLERIAAWAESNALVLNGSKSKYMVLGSKKQIRTICSQNIQISIKGEIVDQVHEARNLGLLMDGELRFEKHIINVASSCFYRLKVLYQIRDSISTDIRLKLCDSLVLSKFNYMDVVYGPRLLARTAKLIQRVQNACARYCFKIPPRTHCTPYLNNANIIKMKHRRETHLATLMFNLVKYQMPVYLYKKLVWSRDVQSYVTRSSGHSLAIPRHRTAAFRGSFRFASTKCWNDLPPPIRSLKSIGIFKKLHKAHVLNVQKNNT